MTTEPEEFDIKQAIRDIENKQMRQVVKDAIKELISEQAQAGGFWLIRVFAIALAGAGVLFILWANGVKG